LRLLPDVDAAQRVLNGVHRAVQERVGHAFVADVRSRPVAADEADMIAERQQLVLDRADQRRVVATGQVGTADRSIEQHVADQCETHLLVGEHHTARRMAGAMQDVESQFADLGLVTFVEPAIRREIAHVGHAEIRAAFDDMIEHVLVGDMRPDDRHLERVAQFGGPADMVDVTMGQPDLLHRDAGLFDRREDLRDVPAGIDNDATPGGFVPEQRAVLLKRRHRDNGGARFRSLFLFHGAFFAYALAGCEGNFGLRQEL
jgi:hypothetical protein